MRFFGTFLAISLLALPAVACGGAEGGAASADSQAADTLKWVTIEGVDFPGVFTEAPEEIVEAYVFAAKHPEVLSYMPCYCGCERETPPHRSNYDCFVDAIDTSGARPRVDPDPMGFG